MCCFHLEGQSTAVLAACFLLVSCLAYSLTLMTEAVCSEMSVDFCRTTWHYIPRDSTLHYSSSQMCWTLNFSNTSLMEFLWNAQIGGKCCLSRSYKIIILLVNGLLSVAIKHYGVMVNISLSYLTCSRFQSSPRNYHTILHWHVETVFFFLWFPRPIQENAT
jgi:hypothetical protein